MYTVVKPLTLKFDTNNVWLLSTNHRQISHKSEDFRSCRGSNRILSKLGCEYNRTKVFIIYSGFITVLLLLVLFYKGHDDKVSVIVSFSTPSLTRKNTPGFITKLPTSYVNFTPTIPSTPATKVTDFKSRSACGDYVIFSDDFEDGRGLGNQIFNLAAGVLIAQLTQRKVAVNNSLIKDLYIEELFDHNYERFNRTCDIYWVNDKHNLAYNPELEMLEASKTANFFNKTISTLGFFQSWKYTINDKLLRDKYLKIKNEFKVKAEKIFAQSLPTGWRPDTFTRVGIHVRRGDVLSEDSRTFGYTTPSSPYFKKAMLYLLNMYKRVQFVVVSNDKSWINSHITPLLFKDVKTTSFMFNITYSTSDDRNLEFTLLASCHHTIMSSGTFGWWAAWLNRGTSIYYKEWPMKGSSLEESFKKEDFFPPNWIGLSD